MIIFVIINKTKILNSLSMLKLLKKEFESLLDLLKWENFLLEGDFLSFEESLYTMILDLYNKISEVLISTISKQENFLEKQRSLAKSKGLKKLALRKSTLYLRTGYKLKVWSYYAKKCIKEYKGSRHLLVLFWNFRAGTSPMYQSITNLLSVLCPSYSISEWLLSYQGINSNFERVRKTSLALSSQVQEKRVEAQLKQEETLSGKRVVISIDGGRCRTRKYNKQKTAKGNKKFETPWKEPKLFVIDVIDKQGNRATKHLPIYDCTFGDDESFELLEKYLSVLQIEQCSQVQFIGDGAKWIWNRAKPMLVKLGVSSDKITETLDYYHASEKLHTIKDYIDTKDKEKQLKKMKDALWQGNLKKLGELIKQSISNVNLEDFTPFQYFKNNEKRIDYQAYSENNLLCGSGVVESGIRRIINLRFKSPSTFWYPENVEKLILMRCIALSGRWEIMVKNINPTS